MKKKDDTLRKLIQQAGPDQPAPDFNELVMRAVRAEAERASNLHALLQQSTPEPPSAAFVQRVMAQVEAAAPKPVEPVISQKAWYLIAAGFVLLVVASLVVAPETQPAASAFWNQTGQALSGLTLAITKVPLLYPLTIIAAGALLLLDYFIRQRVLHSRELEA